MALTPYILNAVANNVNPCELDVVGNAGNPALSYSIDAANITFELRLNGDPRQPSLAGLQPARWGVQVKDANGKFLFAIEVDAKNAPPKVLVRDSTWNQIDNKFELIMLGMNVRVTEVSPGSFPCNAAQPPDPDYLLDFNLPLSMFKDLFDFNNTPFSFCFYTSAAASPCIINKEEPVCGPVIKPTPPPPPGRGVDYWKLEI